MLPLLLVTALAMAPELVDRTVEVDGTSIHLRCGGDRQAGQPIVILEAGGFNSADTWRDVHAPIAAFARVCAYDRPGRGTSPALKDRMTPAEYVAVMKRLLQTAGEAPPYVMVGHSMGGVLAMLFAVRYPTEVSGLVLVDSSHEDQTRRFRDAPPLKPGTVPAAPPGAPEVVAFGALAEALGAAPWRGDVPLVVLSRGRGPSSNDPAVVARETIWLELQRDFLTRSARAEHVIAKNSGHYIHNDEPQLVIDAVRRAIHAK